MMEQDLSLDRDMRTSFQDEHVRTKLQKLKDEDISRRLQALAELVYLTDWILRLRGHFQPSSASESHSETDDKCIEERELRTRGAEYLDKLYGIWAEIGRPGPPTNHTISTFLVSITNP